MEESNGRRKADLFVEGWSSQPSGNLPESPKPYVLQSSHGLQIGFCHSLHGSRWKANLFTEGWTPRSRHKGFNYRSWMLLIMKQVQLNAYSVTTRRDMVPENRSVCLGSMPFKGWVLSKSFPRTHVVDYSGWLLGEDTGVELVDRGGAIKNRGRHECTCLNC